MKTIRIGRFLRVKVLVRALAIGLISLLLIDAFVLQQSNGSKRTATTTMVRKLMPTSSNGGTTYNSATSGNEVKGLKDGSKLEVVDFLASKRKVPRGPDPIHNRLHEFGKTYEAEALRKPVVRAGNSRRPPGLA